MRFASAHSVAVGSFCPSCSYTSFLLLSSRLLHPCFVQKKKHTYLKVSLAASESYNSFIITRIRACLCYRLGGAIVKECTRLEIFERLTLYYNVDNTTIDSVSSSRRVDRMFKRGIKMLDALKFETERVQVKGKLVICQC
jgi:hypothetical protein